MNTRGYILKMNPKYDFYRKLDDFVYNEMFVVNVYRVEQKEITGCNVLDVGGHFGMFSNLCNDLGAKRIIAVEANPHNYLKYIKFTSDIPNGKAINAAVSTTTGEIVTISDKGGLSTVGQGSINVATITLKDAADMLPANEDIFLKMDIEGSEYNAFYSSSHETIRRFSTIAMEVHEFPGETGKIDDLDNFIRSNGFEKTWTGFFHPPGRGVEFGFNGEVRILKYRRI